MLVDPDVDADNHRIRLRVPCAAVTRNVLTSESLNMLEENFRSWAALTCDIGN